MELIHILITGLSVAILFLLYRLFLPSRDAKRRDMHKKKQREEEEKMMNSLADPRIYEPKTNTYITLEEAESGI